MSELFIYGDIGSVWDSEEGVLASKVVPQISAAESLTIRINSYGGSVKDGLAIYSALKGKGDKITGYIEGVAASIASVIAMGCNKLYMQKNAMLMIHAPWSISMGDADTLRNEAEALDKIAVSLAETYANKSGKKVEDFLPYVTGSHNNWLTAKEAKDLGLIDGIVDGVSAEIPVAAMASLYGKLPDFVKEVIEKPTSEKPVSEVAYDPLPIYAAFAPFMDKVGVKPLLQEIVSAKKSYKDAKAELLTHLGKDMEPVITISVDAVDKRRNAITASIMGRANGEAVDAANPYRGYKLLDIARDCLAKVGHSVNGLSQTEIVAAAFGHSTSDFPILLENTMHKTLVRAYKATPDVWSKICSVGSVSDFRPHVRYSWGSFGNLEVVPEGAEYTHGAINDGEKRSISVDTKGKLLSITRQAIINDDLGVFNAIPTAMGRGAKRSIEAAFFTELAKNSGLGPTMEDGFPLFDAAHNNITTSGAMSTAKLDEIRQLMLKQMDIDGNDYLMVAPSVLLCSLAQGSNARLYNTSEFDPGASVTNTSMPNIVRGMYRDIVDTPRLTGTRFYSFGAGTELPTFEVAFLDGMQEPVMERLPSYTIDALIWKVRLEFGIAALEYRSAVTSAGV